MKVLRWLTLCEKIIALDFVSGDNFPPRVFIYPNTFFQGQSVYIGEPGEKPELSEVIDHLYHIELYLVLLDHLYHI